MVHCDTPLKQDNVKNYDMSRAYSFTGT